MHKELRFIQESNESLGQRSLDMLHATKRDLLAALHDHHRLVERNTFWSSAKAHERAQEQNLLRSIQADLKDLRKQATPLATQLHILDSLCFDQMQTRQEMITKTYPETFSWIFHDEVTTFKSWLESDSGIFWIRGKAGSGKSTLMKFLNGHEATRRLLQDWANPKKLVIASFYFWNAGHSMQKSQEGLLRSLLFQILCQCPDLISVATPNRWHDDATSHRYPKPWSKEELTEALNCALSRGPLPCRFCLFIDGLDEYAGDRAELMEVGRRPHHRPDFSPLLEALKTLASSEDVKICASSRPWNPFRNTFGANENRMLVLERLTEVDIKLYIEGMLASHPRFQKLVAKVGQAGELVNEIQGKAQGLFLWVHLAVGSLLKGLSDEDTIPELQNRVRSFPPTLKEYFRSTLASIDEEYLPFTCKLLAMTLFAGCLSTPLPLMAFHFLRLEIGCPDYALQAKMAPLDQDTASVLTDAAVSSVDKWCRDLLQIRFRSGDEIEKLLGGAIGFAHRTVRDFLWDAEISTFLFSHLGRRFEPRISMMRLYLAQLKRLPRPDSMKLEMLYRQNMELLMFWARTCDFQPHVPVTQLLKELDVVGQLSFPSDKIHWTEHLQTTNIFVHWDEGAVKDHEDSSFLALAVSCGLTNFVREELAARPESVRKTGRPLLGYVTRPLHLLDYLMNLPKPVMTSAMLHSIMDAGADPNEIGWPQRDLTIWQAFLQGCWGGWSQSGRSIALAFLEHGADIHCKIPVDLEASRAARVAKNSAEVNDLSARVAQITAEAERDPALADDSEFAKKFKGHMKQWKRHMDHLTDTLNQMNKSTIQAHPPPGQAKSPGIDPTTEGSGDPLNLCGKKLATVEECLLEILSPAEVQAAFAAWRPRTEPSQAITLKQPAASGLMRLLPKAWYLQGCIVALVVATVVGISFKHWLCNAGVGE